MNKDNKLPTLGEFLTQEVKKYQEGVDYNFHEQGGFKTYIIISEKGNKNPKNNSTKLPILIILTIIGLIILSISGLIIKKRKKHGSKN